jgi:hypothetical protein
MTDLKEDIKDLEKAGEALQKAIDAEKQAEKDKDQKVADAEAESRKLATTPQAQLQAQYKKALDAEKAAVAAWNDLRKAQRDREAAQKKFADALFELYQDIFAIGPVL